MLRGWELLAISATFPHGNLRKKGVDGRICALANRKNKIGFVLYFCKNLGFFESRSF
jgi:hypothetical protein